MRERSRRIILVEGDNHSSRSPPGSLHDAVNILTGVNSLQGAFSLETGQRCILGGWTMDVFDIFSVHLYLRLFLAYGGVYTRHHLYCTVAIIHFETFHLPNRQLLKHLLTGPLRANT